MPWLPFLALFGAILTVFLALITMLAINHKPIWPSDGVFAFVQPASVLSLFLSMTAILAAYALSEGVIVTWWYQYPRPSTTIAHLQDIWTVGTSPLDALIRWRKCKRVALATVFVALLPLNAFVLQGAVITEPWTKVEKVNITIPMVPYVDYGFSGGGLINASSPVFGSAWSWMWQQVVNVAGNSLTQYAYFGSRDVNTNQLLHFDYDNTSTYTMVAQGAGFDVDCSMVDGEHFELAPTNEKPQNGGQIFSSTIGWTPEKPNEIEITVAWKLGPNCNGNLKTKRCILRAATVEYPIQLEMSVDDTPYLGPFFSLQRNARDKAGKTIRILSVDPNEGKGGNWTYSGIALSLGWTFNSTMRVWDDLDGGGGTAFTGSFAPSLNPNWYNNGYYYCSISFDNGLEAVEYYQLIDSSTINPDVVVGDDPDQGADPTDIIIGRLRQGMFLASVYTGSEKFNEVWTTTTNENGDTVLPYPYNHYAQVVEATKITPIVRYSVRLYLWGASLAITGIVILFILPTFWGYWKLPRYPGLSPVDVARAFKAPIVAEIQPETATHRALKAVGSKSIHQESGIFQTDTRMAQQPSDVLHPPLEEG